MGVVCRFHGSASFKPRLICSFSATMSPITQCLKIKSFFWTREAEKAFKQIKTARSQSTSSSAAGFEKLFLVECDTNHVRIAAVPSHDGRPHDPF